MALLVAAFLRADGKGPFGKAAVFYQSGARPIVSAPGVCFRHGLPAPTMTMNDEAIPISGKPPWK
jgi:hypothetical protein